MGDIVQSCFALGSRLNMRLQSLRQPVVACVHGHAMAAGLELASSCDIVIAGTNAQFSMPGVTRGRFCHTPAVSVAQRIHPRKAYELALFGTVLSAQQAEKFGLANMVVSDAAFDEESEEVIQRLASLSPNAVQQGKQGFYAVLHAGSLEEKYAVAKSFMVPGMRSADSVEGTRSLFEKRMPVYDNAPKL